MELNSDFDLTFLNDSDDDNDDFLNDSIFSEFKSKHLVKPSDFLKSSSELPCLDKLPLKCIHSPNKTTRISNKEKFKHCKLPGPAGLLPKLHEHGHRQRQIIGPKSSKKKKDNTISNLSEYCLSPSLSQNQSPSSQSEEAALLSRLQSECGSSIWSVVEKYSVREILKMITSNQLPKGKVPIMCGFLDEVELMPTDAKALLKDNTGVLACTIHRSVIKEYKNDLSCCSLLLLKQVTIFSPTGKKFYANITLSNVVKIYTSENTFITSTSDHMTAPLSSPLSLQEVETLEADCLRAPSPPSTPQTSQACPISPILKPINSYRIQPQVNKFSSSLNSELSHMKNCTPSQLRPSGLGSLLKSNSLSVNNKVRSICDNNNNNNNNNNSSEKIDEQENINPLLTLMTTTTATPTPTPTALITATTPSDTITMRNDLLEDDMDDLLSSIADDMP